MDQKGYVLIAFNDWTIESSVVVLVMVVFLFYAGLQLVEWGVVNLLSLWGRTRHWFGWRRHQLAREKTLSSILDLASGRFDLAEKNSARYASLSDQPILNYLTAANAAQRLGKKQQRDKYLESAALIDSDDSALVATRLKLLVDEQEFEAASSWLAQQASTPKQPQLMHLALQVYRATGQWQLVLSLILPLLKQKQISQQQCQAFEVEAHCGLLADIAQQDIEQITPAFKGLSRKLRNNIDIFSHYAKLNIKSDRFDVVEDEIFKRLRKHMEPGLIELLSEVPEEAAQRSGEKLIPLEKNHPQEVMIPQTIAQLFIKVRCWEQSKVWTLKAIEITPSASLYHQLARAQQELGEKNGALASYNNALAYL